MRELCLCIPNSEVRDRRNADLKKIIPKAIEHGYTDMVVVNEDHKEPSIRNICFLIGGIVSAMWLGAHYECP